MWVYGRDYSLGIGLVMVLTQSGGKKIKKNAHIDDTGLSPTWGVRPHIATIPKLLLKFILK